MGLRFEHVLWLLVIRAVVLARFRPHLSLIIVTQVLQWAARTRWRVIVTHPLAVRHGGPVEII